MPEAAPVKTLPRLTTRREYFDYFDRWSVGTVDNLRAHVGTRALVKAYLLETSRTNGSRDALSALGNVHQEISQVDDTLYRLRWPAEEQDWSLVEIEDQRYPVLYTVLDSDAADHRVNEVVHASPSLDKAWFAAPMFQQLWTLVLNTYPPHRFAQMVFEYDSVYEDVGEDVAAAHDEDTLGGNVDNEYSPWHERRRARMQIAERVGKLHTALENMRQHYEPLESIVRLRVPAPQRGGHDVYFDGKFTNRSDSITSLRQLIAVVTNLYRRSTELAEAASWPKTANGIEGAQPISLGVPLLVKFSRELELVTFERWIASLRRKNNRFRLWGNPIDMGPGKVHLYGVDHHLWQPIDLEITRKYLYALLPSGTCGNTIHRLVTNIQRFVDPKLTTFIGDQRYEDIIGETRGSDVDGGSSSDR